MCINNLRAGSEMIHVLHLTCPIIRRLKYLQIENMWIKKNEWKPRQKGTVSDGERRNVKRKCFSICMQIPCGILMLLLRMDDAYFKIFKFTSEICQTTKQAWDRTTLHQSKINSNAKSGFISNNRKKVSKLL